MKISTVFTVFAIVLTLLTAHIGDSTNVSWNIQNGVDYEILGFMYALVLLIGMIAFIFFFIYLCKADTKERQNEQYQIAIGFCIAITAICAGYLYGFSVGPFNKGGYAWLDGWLAYLIVGLLPVAINVNESVKELLEKHRVRQAANQTEAKVTKLR